MQDDLSPQEPKLLFEDDLSPQEPKLLFEDDLSNGSVISSIPAFSHANNVQQQHPFLYKIAQALQGTPGLDKAANIAGHINRTVEGTGFPSVARGAFGGAINMARGLANLAPGVNIPEAQYPELDVNPIVGQLGETGGSVIASIPAFKGYQALKGGLGKVPGVNKVPEYIRAILAGGATGSALSPDHRILGGALGIGSEIIPNIIGKVVSKGKEWLYGPANELKSHDYMINNVERILEKNKGDINKSKEEAANYFNSQLEKSHKAEELSKANIEKQVPNESKEKSSEMLSKEISRKEEEISDHFNKRYEDFANSAPGKQHIKEPFTLSEIKKTVSGIKNISPTTARMAKEVSSFNKKLTLLDPNSKNLVSKVLPKKSTVSDYIQFMREVRDASNNASHKVTTDASLTLGQKDEFKELAENLKTLQKHTENKIKATIPDKYKDFDQIQSDYSKLYLPFRKSESGGVLYNAAKEGKITPSLHTELNQPRNKYIRESLIKDPKVREALLQHAIGENKHPLAKSSLESQASHIKSLESQNKYIYNLMNNNQKNALSQHVNIANQRKIIEKLLTKVNSSEFDTVLNSLERNTLKKYSPQAEKSINNIESQFTDKVDLETKLSKLLEEKIRKVTSVEDRDEQKKLAKWIASLLGVSIGGSYIGKKLL